MRGPTSECVAGWGEISATQALIRNAHESRRRAPSPALLRLRDLSPHRGEGESKRSRSRNAIRVGVTCRASCELRESLFPIHHSPLAFVFPQKEGEAERRQTQSTTAASCGCGARPFGARTPDGVPPRLSPEGIIPSQRLGSGQASWDAVCTGVTRLRLSQSREAPPTPVIMPGDMMPKPPGSGLQIRPRAPHPLHLTACLR